jgi:hypothetical protein
MIIIVKPVGTILATTVDGQDKANSRQCNVHAQGYDVFISRCLSVKCLEFPVVEIQVRQLLVRIWALCRFTDFLLKERLG